MKRSTYGVFPLVLMSQSRAAEIALLPFKRKQTRNAVCLQERGRTSRAKQAYWESKRQKWLSNLRLFVKSTVLFIVRNAYSLTAGSKSPASPVTRDPPVRLIGYFNLLSHDTSFERLIEGLKLKQWRRE